VPLPGHARVGPALRHVERLVHHGASGDLPRVDRCRSGVFQQVPSAKTTVDQARNFIAEFYRGTSVERSYDARIAADIAQDKICRFVHDVRNYMLHCRVPNLLVWSSIDMHGEVQAGVRLDLATLREWNGWTSASKDFLHEQPKDDIELDDVTRSYCHKIVGFHVWIDQCLLQYHKDELAELEDLRARLKTLSNHPSDADKRTWDDWRIKIHFNALPWKPLFNLAENLLLKHQLIVDGAETPSRCQLILVNDTAETIAAENASLAACRHWWPLERNPRTSICSRR
jgi:hypothetical protein